MFLQESVDEKPVKSTGCSYYYTWIIPSPWYNSSGGQVYSDFWGIPLAGATLPVIAFFMLGIYGKVVCMLIATVILGIGHIGIHIEHRKRIDVGE